MIIIYYVLNIIYYRLYIIYNMFILYIINNILYIIYKERERDACTVSQLGSLFQGS